MYDYDQLVDAAYAFLNIGLITMEEYARINNDIDELVAMKSRLIRFE